MKLVNKMKEKKKLQEVQHGPILILRQKHLKEQHGMYLEERNPKRDPCDDSQVGLHRIGHPCEAALHSTEMKTYRVTLKLVSKNQTSFKL